MPWPYCMAYWTLLIILQLGIEPLPPAVEAPSLNHWTTREVLAFVSFSLINCNYIFMVTKQCFKNDLTKVSNFDSKLLHTFLICVSLFLFFYSSCLWWENPQTWERTHSEKTFLPAISILITVRLKIWVCTNEGVRF